MSDINANDMRGDRSRDMAHLAASIDWADTYCRPKVRAKPCPTAWSVDTPSEHSDYTHTFHLVRENMKTRDWYWLTYDRENKDDGLINLTLDDLKGIHAMLGRAINDLENA